MFKQKQARPVTPKRARSFATLHKSGNQQMRNLKQALPVRPAKARPFADLLPIKNLRHQLIPVQLPDQENPIFLAPTLATTLKAIVDAGARGIDTLSLQRMGICNVDNAMYRLRQRDIDIQTVRRPAINEHDELVRSIGHYHYRLDCDSARSPSTKTGTRTKAEPQMDIFQKIMSIVKGIFL